MQRGVNAIRLIDTETPIMIECLTDTISGSIYSYGSFRSAVENPISGHNLMYSVNWYEMAAAKQIDMYLGGNYENYDDLVTWLSDPRMAWKQALEKGYSINVGEFGLWNGYESLAWYRNLLRIMDEWKVGWNAWWWSTVGTNALIADWNGTPTSLGQLPQTHL